ncbi:DNA mismatch repair protein - MLH1 family, partial [Trachipleistophora hominis]
MTIRKLPPSIINRISAGEVITRPLSVIKELLENSIDAGASVIRVGYAENIVMEDNGSGITEDDFELLCARYCTSKLSDECDKKRDILDNVCTYGFRGEALASISDVSTVVVRTKTTNCAYGHVLVYEHGVLISKKKEAMKNGTMITVKDLFGNNAMRKTLFQ